MNVSLNRLTFNDNKIERLQGGGLEQKLNKSQYQKLNKSILRIDNKIEKLQDSQKLMSDLMGLKEEREKLKKSKFKIMRDLKAMAIRNVFHNIDTEADQKVWKENKEITEKLKQNEAKNIRLQTKAAETLYENRRKEKQIIEELIQKEKTGETDSSKELEEELVALLAEDKYLGEEGVYGQPTLDEVLFDLEQQRSQLKTQKFELYQKMAIRNLMI